MRVLFLHLRMDLLIFAQHLVQYSTHARRMVLLGLGTHRLQTSGLKLGRSLRTKRWHAPLRNRVRLHPFNSASIQMDCSKSAELPSPMITCRVANYALKIQEFDVSIEYVEGKLHVVPDCLSRAAKRGEGEEGG